MNLQNNAKDEWSKDLRQLIGEIVITMGTEKGEKLVTEIKNKIHQQLQKAREEERERIKKDLDRRLEIQKKVSSSEYEGGYTHALQDVKEAYQSELDQLTRDDWNEDMERSHTLAELDQDKI